MTTRVQSNASDANTIPVFICYRQIDGKDVATRVFELLAGQDFESSDLGCLFKLDIYFDQRAPGIGDWTSLHEPYLKRSRAFILICTPGAKIDEGPDDWVHREIDWWLDNRGFAPILVDALGQGLRYVPNRVAEKWPKAQRIVLVDSEWRRLEGNDLANEQARVRAGLLGGIAPSAANMYREELAREKVRAAQLQTALRKAKWALSVAFLLMIGAAVLAYAVNSERSKADTRLTAALAIVDRVTDRILLQNVHAGGYPGKELADMLQSISHDLARIDPAIANPDVQILRFRILGGLDVQNQYINAQPEDILQCRQIVLLLLKAAPDRLAEIDALSCLSHLLTAMSVARSPILKDRYDRVCAIDHRLLGAELSRVARIEFQNPDRRARAKARIQQLLTEIESSSTMPLDLFSCPSVSQESYASLAKDLDRLLAETGAKSR